jgi:hypothetical protein
MHPSKPTHTRIRPVTWMHLIGNRMERAVNYHPSVGSKFTSVVMRLASFSSFNLFNDITGSSPEYLRFAGWSKL